MGNNTGLILLGLAALFMFGGASPNQIAQSQLPAAWS
ncbi:unnamed protein product, partial [marine sediment metagenome]